MTANHSNVAAEDPADETGALALNEKQPDRKSQR